VRSGEDIVAIEDQQSRWQYLRLLGPVLVGLLLSPFLLAPLVIGGGHGIAGILEGVVMTIVLAAALVLTYYRVYA